MISKFNLLVIFNLSFCILVAKCASISLADQDVKESPDTSHFANINGKLYFIGNNPTGISVLPEDGMVMCNEMGMTLVGFETAQEMYVIIDYLNNNGLGKRKYLTSGRSFDYVWAWSNSGTVFYRDDPRWANPAPTNGLTVCAYLDPAEGLLSQECNNLSLYYICESA